MDQPTFVADEDLELAQIVERSNSLADVIRALEMPLNSSSYTTVNRRIKHAKLSIEHFHTAAKPRKKPSPPTKVLRLRHKQEGRENAERLRNALRAAGVRMVCVGCGIGPAWRGMELTLEVDHIDGNPLDCRMNNLRFMCPNCHQQTDTYGRRQRPARKVLVFLVEQHVREIREAWGPYQKGRRGRVSAKVLASQYGVSTASIYHIVQRRRWKHVL